jgi:hypothetical protein
MVLLVMFFVFRGGVPDDLKKVASVILQHLSLLFVPAGVGLMLHAARRPHRSRMAGDRRRAAWQYRPVAGCHRACLPGLCATR